MAIVGIAMFAGLMLAQEKPCPTASNFGPNDQIGNINHVTPAKTLAASKLVTTGKAYRLGIETNKNTAAYGHRTFSLTVLQPDQAGGASWGPTKTTFNDDLITGWIGVGSQIDGLGHAGIDGLYFNCNKANDFSRVDGLTKLGIENVPAIATRAVLLDMAGYLGTDIVKEGVAFNRAEIEGAMKRQGLRAIEKGDIVLLYTGWMSLLGKDDKRFIAANPGLGREGARYLASLGVAAVGADTANFEVIPFEKDAGLYEVHQILLAENGIYILENLKLDEMARDKAWESFFTLGPTRITGSVQAWINPIAIR
ncbi:MAG: cyclase family protein [Acidobacteria bacterium]|nr:cyclase family protein [Acidobacteriota bacterium]